MKQKKEAEQLLKGGSIFGFAGLNCNEIFIVLGGQYEKHANFW
jgi:hypothetical protein